MKFKTYYRKYLLKHKQVPEVNISKTKIFAIFEKKYKKIINMTRYRIQNSWWCPCFWEMLQDSIICTVTSTIRHEITPYNEFLEKDYKFNRGQLNYRISKNIPENIKEMFLEWLKFNRKKEYKKLTGGINEQK